MVAFLLDHGADINTNHANVGTPLHVAVTTNNVKVARLLLDRGAQVKVWNL
jgi:ankyrin repeat protein